MGALDGYKATTVPDSDSKTEELGQSGVEEAWDESSCPELLPDKLLHPDGVSRESVKETAERAKTMTVRLGSREN